MKSRPLSMVVLSVGVALAAYGCVMPDQMNQIQKDLTDVRQQLREVRTDQDATVRKLEAIESKPQQDDNSIGRAEFADLSSQLDRVERQVTQSSQRMSDLGTRVEQLSQQIGSASRGSSSMRPAPQAVVPPPTAPAAPVTVSEATPDPGALYNTAYTDFSKGNYALAISGFEEFVEKFSDNPTADNALYWIGECHFSQGSFGEAIAAFDGLLERYPQSDKAAAANLKKALAFLEQNQIGQAIVQFRYVDTTFPGSDEAKIARDKLTSLGAPI